jgi:hypothetical protein
MSIFTVCIRHCFKQDPELSDNGSYLQSFHANRHLLCKAAAHATFSVSLRTKQEINDKPIREP